eukprot:ANDGO_00011.mRNA.1 U3 small nucleolar RNA-associated protein 21 homolog
MSQLFEPFRALGFVTASRVPAVIETHGVDSFVTTSIGKTFHLYSLAHMKLVLVGSPSHPSEIVQLAVRDPYTFTVCASHPNSLRVHKRGKLMDSIDCPTHILSLCVIGDVIVAVSADGWISVIQYKVKGKNRVAACFQVDAIAGTENSVAVCHPHTYLNKIVVGSFLVNFKTQRVVHQFSDFDSFANSKEKGEKMLVCMKQSPVVDVVACGFSNGAVELWNLKFEKKLFAFVHKGRIQKLSFRTDGTPQLAVTCEDGDVYFWDLDKRVMTFRLSCGVAIAAEFLQSEPLMVVTGKDNSLRVYIFDQSDGSCRLLRERSGHSDTVRKVRWFSDNVLLTYAQDHAMRLCTLRNDANNSEFSQKKQLAGSDHDALPVMTDIAFQPIRSLDWADVVTVHRSFSTAYLWRTETRSCVEKKLVLKSRGKCCAVTPCGNFALIGCENGKVYKYNMQSGFLRQTYSLENEKAEELDIFKDMDEEENTEEEVSPDDADGPLNEDGEPIKEDSAVLCLGVDDRNERIWAGYASGRVIQYPSKRILEFSSAVSCMRIQPSVSGLVAVACDDMYVRVLDEMRTVRVFSNGLHSSPIVDLAWSPDGRMLVSASSDGTICCWDIINSVCVDAFRTPAAITSIDFDPSGFFLATTHADEQGIFLWTNKSKFMNVLPKAIGSKHDVATARLPVSGTIKDQTEQIGSVFAADADVDVDNKSQNEESDSDEEISTENSTEEDPEDDDGAYGRAAKRRRLEEVDYEAEEEFISFAGVPRPKWATLALLDVIRERNKPKQPVEKQRLPFFLQLQQSQDGRVVSSSAKDLSAMNDKDESNSWESRILSSIKLPDVAHSPLTQSVVGGEDNDSATVQELLSLSASALDLEIQTIGSADALVSWLNFLSRQIRSKKNYELVQGILSLLIKVHGSVLQRAHSSQLDEAVKRIEEAQSESWIGMDRLFHETLCMAHFFSQSSAL